MIKHFVIFAQKCAKIKKLLFYNGSVMVFLAEVYEIEEIFGKAKTDCKIHNFSQNFIYTKKAKISVMKIFCLYNADTYWHLRFAQYPINSK